MKEKVPALDHYTLNDVITKFVGNQFGAELVLFDNNDINPNLSSFRPARSNHFTMMLVTAGSFYIRANLIEYTLTERSFFVIPPNIVHELRGMSDDCMFYGIAFSTSFLGQSGLHKKHIDAFGFFTTINIPDVLLTPQECNTLLSTILLLKSKNDISFAHNYTKEVLEHIFCAFLYDLAAIMQANRKTDFVKLTRKEDLAMRFLKILPLHFKEERSVQFFAELLFVSPKYLTQTVKEITGKTAGELIDEIVIVEAKVLLNDLSLSVANVADSLHFSDQFFFSKFFKKHSGFTPTDYRSNF